MKEQPYFNSPFGRMYVAVESPNTLRLSAMGKAVLYRGRCYRVGVLLRRRGNKWAVDEAKSLVFSRDFRSQAGVNLKREISATFIPFVDRWAERNPQAFDRGTLRREQFEGAPRGVANEIAELSEGLRTQAERFRITTRAGLFEPTLNRKLTDNAQQFERMAKELARLMKEVKGAKYREAA